MEENKPNTKKEHKKLIFALKFIIWASFSCIIPIAIIVWKFVLIDETEASGNFSVRIGLWALIALIIFMSFSKTLVKYISELKMGSWQSLLLSGLVNTTIPLVLLYLCLVALENNIPELKQVILYIAISETISYSFNPFPKLINQNILGVIEKGIDKVKEKLK